MLLVAWERGCCLSWGAEGWVGIIICGMEQCDEGKALIALLWAEKNTGQTVPVLPEKLTPKGGGDKKAFHDMVWLTGSAGCSSLFLAPWATISVCSSICPFPPTVCLLPLLGSPGTWQGQVTVPCAAAQLLWRLSCGKRLGFYK